MTRYTLSILHEHYAQLKSLLLRDRLEYGALMLCGRSRHVDPWTGEVEERALVLEVIDVGLDAFSERTATSMTWDTKPILSLAKRASTKGFALCIAHSHPRGGLEFSLMDDEADADSMHIIFNRIETDRPHLSLIMDNEGELVGRAFGPDLKPVPLNMIRIVGDQFTVRYTGRQFHQNRDEFDRSVRTFGPQAIADFSALRIGIIGNGGTGSAVASLLGRLGSSRLLLVDNDRVERTNLNRMHFSQLSDAILRNKKVEVVARELAAIGLTDAVVMRDGFVDSPDVRDALLSCDLIFGCTDDDLGREFLNRIAHFYLIPVIDMGLLIEPNDSGGYEVFDGRVTVVQPGYPCQVCRDLISPTRMLEQDMIRRDPEMFEQRRRAGYVVGGIAPNPAVVTFTTEVACMAVNEMLHRLTGFRGAESHASERVRNFRFLKDSDCIPAGASKDGCPLCGLRKWDGRGDMEPFLNRT